MKTTTASAGSGRKGLQHATRYRWVILFLAFIFAIINNADRANLGVVLPYIKKEFFLTNLQAGALASSFFLGYAISQIPAGLIMGRVGARLMTALSIFACSVFTFLFGASSGTEAMNWVRFGLGLGEGPAGVGATGLRKAWFPNKEQATAGGIYLASSQVALILVPPVCTVIMIHWGWRMVFYSFALPGIAIAAIWYVFVRNRPEESPYCNALEQEYIRQSNPEAQSQKDPHAESLGWVDVLIRARRGMHALNTNSQVLRSWNIWANGIVYFFLSMCQFGMLTWIPSYLVNERHFSMIRMGLAAAVPPCGSCIGFIGGGWLSDSVWRARRKPMMFLSAIAGGIMMYLLANAPVSQATMTVLLFFNGLAMSCGMSVYVAYPMSLTTRKTFPTALGIVFTAGALGGFISPMIAGYLLDTFKTFSAVFYFFTFALAMNFLFALTMVEPLQTIDSEVE